MNNLPVVSPIRRNHALEHATIHVLKRQYPHLSLLGRSDWGGFSIIGQVSTEAVEQAANEALARLKAGESKLAIHPFCGTGLAVSGLLSGLAAFLTLSLRKSKRRFSWSQLPEALLAAVAAAILAQPLGIVVQRELTTDANPGDLHIRHIYRRHLGQVPVHRVETA